MTPFISTHRVEFCDTDMAGIAHFTAFFRYMEAAEHAFLRSRGLSVVQEEGGPAGAHISWPRVAASCDYKSPARFGDLLEIEVRLEKLGEKSAVWQHLIRCGGRELAVGQMTSVCCRIVPGQRPASIVIPPDLRAKLEA